MKHRTRHNPPDYRLRRRKRQQERQKEEALETARCRKAMTRVVDVVTKLNWQERRRVLRGAAAFFDLVLVETVPYR